MLLHNVITKNILQGAYCNTDICFFGGKYEILRRELYLEFRFTRTVEECKFSLISITCLLQLRNNKNFHLHFCADVREGYRSSY